MDGKKRIDGIDLADLASCYGLSPQSYREWVMLWLNTDRIYQRQLQISKEAFEQAFRGSDMTLKGAESLCKTLEEARELEFKKNCERDKRRALGTDPGFRPASW